MSDFSFWLAVITIGSLIVSILAVIVSFYLYRWRVKLSDEKAILVPECLIQRIDRQIKLLEELKRANPELEKLMITSVKQISEKTNNIEDILLRFQGALNAKDKEIDRLKKGYDKTIYKRFLGRFLRVYMVVSDLKSANGLVNDDLQKIKLLFEDAFEESGVELFSLEKGKNYLDHNHLLEEQPEEIETFDSALNETVAETLRPGLRAIDSPDTILVKSKVKIYKAKGGS